MALGVTHILGTIVLLDLLRHYYFGKEKFPRYLLVIGGIAGLLPDIDIPLGWIVSFVLGERVHLHGGTTHSLLFGLVFLFIGLCFFYKNNWAAGKWSSIFFVISFGCIVHLFFDCFFGGYAGFFWPSGFDTTLLCPNWDIQKYAIEIDAILLILWLIHEEMHKRIRDYI